MSPTLNAFDNASESRATVVIANATQVRRLTPLECERLQGFPDNWTAQRVDEKSGQVVEQSDAARYRQTGNAIAVPVFEWVLSRLVSAHADTKADVWVSPRDSQNVQASLFEDGAA